MSVAKSPAEEEKSELPLLDVTYTNVWAAPNAFKMTRSQRQDRVEDQILRLANEIKAGCWKSVVSVAATKYSFNAMVTTSLTYAEVQAKGFPRSGVKSSRSDGMALEKLIEEGNENGGWGVGSSDDGEEKEE